MFFIFKILPNWVWYLLPVLGLFGFFASYLPQLKTYDLILKTLSCTTIAVGIFILGMLYSDNAWNSAAKDLKTKVAALQAESEAVNTTIKEKLITKTQVVRVRGDSIIQYVDREVARSDAGCTIPAEFVRAHNQAAEQPR